MAGRDSAHDGTGPAAVFFEVIQREREDLVGREPGAILVHDAKTVGIAIEAEAHLRLAATDEFADGFHAMRIRFRVNAAKQRVVLVMETGDLDTAILQQGVEIAATRAIHQLDGELHLRLFDDVKLDELFERLEIFRQRINLLALCLLYTSDAADDLLC